MQSRTIYYSYLSHALLLILSFLFPAQATIVRVDIGVGGDQPLQEVYIELFDLQTPVTVANFLNYIENTDGDRRYDGTFMHRSITDFIVQGGGFNYDPANGPFSATIPHIAVDAQIVNEFDPARSNLRGTIAMAKLAGNPDSATSEWFFNLADNSANLDNQNGGFTVFGRVLDQDMPVVDSIAALSTENQGGPFTDLPTTRDTTATPPTIADLVIINKVEVIATARVRTNVSELDFGSVPPGSTSTPQTLIIQNVGSTDLVVDSILNPFVPDLPFRVVRDECSSSPLQPTASCEVDLQFEPVSIGNVQNVTFINSNDSSAPSKPINVQGIGALSTATLSIPEEFNEIDFEDIFSSSEKSVAVTLSNIGATDLIFLDFIISGRDAAAFSIEANDCIQVTPQQGSCTVTVTFTPGSTGAKTATLGIHTNDATTPVAEIPLLASASEDHDGIADAIEAGAPNTGDGNLDGILDSLQDNVTSLRNINGDYVTLESTNGTRLSAVVADTNPSLANSPTTGSGDTLVFPHGFYSFIIEDVPPSGNASVTIYLPEGETTSIYVKYSPITNSWFTFDFDPRTQTGAEINGNSITLHFVDGGRGDADFLPNGRIFDPGGPATIPAASGSSSSGGGGCSVSGKTGKNSPINAAPLILLSLLLAYRFNRYRRKTTSPGKPCIRR
ncbi:peptidylprolyl isomerase [Pseudomonadota bacterium]